MENLFTVLYYLSALGFLVAALVMAFAVGGFGKSTLGSVFSYLFLGTGVFFLITVFQTLGAEFFGISDESMDVWWHIMFYLAFLLYFIGLKSLVGLGQAESSTNNAVKVGSEKTWGCVALLVLIGVFTLPSSLEPFVLAYAVSAPSIMGLHHFLAFAIAGLVAWYLLSAKKNLGQIGKTIANPMIIAVGALCVQHFWELLTESWKVFEVSSETIEGVEKIFLVVSAACVLTAAWRLKKFSRPAGT